MIPIDETAGTPDSVVLHRANALDMLAFLRGCGSLQALRALVAYQLRALDVDAPESRPWLTSPDEPQSVVFSRQHLVEDLSQILHARTLERARYYVDRLQKGIDEVRTNGLNDVNLNRWKEYDDLNTDSLWVVDRRDRSGVHTSDYWGNFVPQIPNQLIRRYTKEGEWVLDLFLGCGTTLIESQRLGRNGIGVELQPAVAEQARQAVACEPNSCSVVSQVVVGDSTSIDLASTLAPHGQGSVQLAILHPPYFDIIQFSDDPRDLSNASSVDAFLDLLGKAVGNAASVLDRGRYLGLVIGDKYARGELVPLGFLAMSSVLGRGDFTLKSIVVKNFEETTGKRQQKELWRYRALVGGFYVFKHEYVFIFCKR